MSISPRDGSVVIWVAMTFVLLRSGVGRSQPAPSRKLTQDGCGLVVCDRGVQTLRRDEPGCIVGELLRVGLHGPVFRGATAAIGFGDIAERMLLLDLHGHATGDTNRGHGRHLLHWIMASLDHGEIVSDQLLGSVRQDGTTRSK